MVRPPSLFLVLSQCFAVGGALSSAATIYALPLPRAPTLSCGLEALSCTPALTSDFSSVGEVPLGVIGVMYFVFLALGTRAYQRTGNQEYAVPVTWLGTLGLVGSVVMSFIMFVVLQAPCLYCLITHAMNLAFVVVFFRFRSWAWPKMGTDAFWHWLSIAAIALLAGLCVYFANEARIAKAKLATYEDLATETHRDNGSLSSKQV